MIKYLIIDDEPIAHRIIEGYCEVFPNMEKQGNCYNAFEAMQLLNDQSVDLIFLDINMPRLTGFEFLKSLSNPPKVIVTTAYKEFAIEGYELDISDYLLKPFSLERFAKAVNKIISSLKKEKQQATEATIVKTQIVETDTKSTKFFLKGDKKHHQIDTQDILYIEAYGNYTKMYFADEMIISHEKISSFADMLPSDSFMRVHKSFVVSLDKIEQIEGNRIIIGKHKIPVGQTYKSVVSGLFN
ncbi:MAG: response regulator transcription factor [Flavobacteriaceae bacterium]|nr:response regulator transcription factor [Flavobacteriaceae bacterium]